MRICKESRPMPVSSLRYCVRRLMPPLYTYICVCIHIYACINNYEHVHVQKMATNACVLCKVMCAHIPDDKYWH